MRSLGEIYRRLECGKPTIIEIVWWYVAIVFWFFVLVPVAVWRRITGQKTKADFAAEVYKPEPPVKSSLRFGCRECDWRGTENEIVRIKDPASKTRWNICPKCRSAEQFDNLCDEPGCNAPSSCGWVDGEVYRRTCSNHWGHVAATESSKTGNDWL